MRVLAVAVAKTVPDHQQVADVLREGMLLLQDPAVHQQSALEDLILRAPYWGGLESWLHKKPHFHLGKDLPHYITAREGRGGLSVQEVDRLNARFADYQWSQTPKVWDSYLRARRICSCVCNNQGARLDPSDVAGPLLASLRKLVYQSDVQGCKHLGALNDFLKGLAALHSGCQHIPEELSFWQSVRASLLPGSTIGRKQIERFRALEGLERDVRDLCHALQPALIAFGVEYRQQYIRQEHSEATNEA